MKSKVKAALLVSVLAASAAALPALAEEDPAMAPGIALGQAVTLKATVAAIDLETRQVTLKGRDGDTVSFVVGPEARNLEQVHVGDEVEISYYDGLAMVLEPAGDQKRSREEKVEVSRADVGQKPAATVTRTVDAVGVIKAVNSEARLVLIKGAKKEVLLTVGPDIDLSAIKVGDRVFASYVESFAISVKPAAAK